jgi:hypothetical protein
MRRAVGGAPRRPLGQFAGNPPNPTNPTAAVVRELGDSLTGDPGIRLAGATGRRRFYAGGLTVQEFPAAFSGAGSGPATDEALAAAAIQAGTRRRSLGQFRGLPSMASVPADAPPAA